MNLFEKLASALAVMDGALTISANCAICGRSFTYEKPRSGRRRKFCSTECKHRAQLQRQEGYRRAGVRYADPTYEGECEMCGKPFQSHHREQRTCSRRCGGLRSLHTKEKLRGGSFLGGVDRKNE